jgi:hypothetical protein
MSRAKRRTDLEAISWASAFTDSRELSAAGRAADRGDPGGEERLALALRPRPQLSRTQLNEWRRLSRPPVLRARARRPAARRVRQSRRDTRAGPDSSEPSPSGLSAARSRGAELRRFSARDLALLRDLADVSPAEETESPA